MALPGTPGQLAPMDEETADLSQQLAKKLTEQTGKQKQKFSTKKSQFRKGKLMKHCGTKKLETDRLVLRRYVNEDAAAMYKNWASNEDIFEYPANLSTCNSYFNNEVPMPNPLYFLQTDIASDGVS